MAMGKPPSRDCFPDNLVPAYIVLKPHVWPYCFIEHVSDARPDCHEYAGHVGADAHCCARASGTKRQSRAVDRVPRDACHRAKTRGARHRAIGIAASRRSCMSGR
jgi:hypothetical protein